jgi:hypothetical protein
MGGGMDAFIVKFDTSGTRLWATYYGGTQFESSNSYCAVDILGDVYLTGSSNSTNGISLNGHQNTYTGGSLYGDAFVAKFSSLGTRLWGTYYGGSVDDVGVSCDVDDSGNVYVAGWTKSSNNIAFKGHQNTIGGSEDAFLIKLNASGNRLWGTYYGGGSYDRANSCSVDNGGNVYFAGGAWSLTGIAFNGHQNTHSVGWQNDGFLAKIICKDSVADVQFACDSYTWTDGVTYTSSNATAMQILTIGNSNSGTDVIIGCDSLTWIDGLTYTANNNSATFTVTNASGCDSLVALDLTLLNSSVGTDTQIACDSYTSISGNTWTTSGTYFDTSQIELGGEVWVP